MLIVHWHHYSASVAHHDIPRYSRICQVVGVIFERVELESLSVVFVVEGMEIKSIVVSRQMVF